MSEQDFILCTYPFDILENIEVGNAIVLFSILRAYIFLIFVLDSNNV